MRMSAQRSVQVDGTSGEQLTQTTANVACAQSTNKSMFCECLTASDVCTSLVVSDRQVKPGVRRASVSIFGVNVTLTSAKALFMTAMHPHLLMQHPLG